MVASDGQKLYFDYKDGKYGYNTNPNRGADTFFPFSSALSSFETIQSASITATKDYKVIIASSYQAIETDIQINGVSKWNDVLHKDRTYCLFVDGKAGDKIRLVKPTYYDWDIITLIG